MLETVMSVTKWADETFGPATELVQVERAIKEMREMVWLIDEYQATQTPIDWGKVAEEAADVVICLYRVIGHCDPDAIEKKMAINRARKWNVAKDGTAQHIEEGT